MTELLRRRVNWKVDAVCYGTYRLYIHREIHNKPIAVVKKEEEEENQKKQEEDRARSELSACCCFIASGSFS